MGYAQYMCDNCTHSFCWSVNVDFPAIICRSSDNDSPFRTSSCSVTEISFCFGADDGGGFRANAEEEEDGACSSFRRFCVRSTLKSCFDLFFVSKVCKSDVQIHNLRTTRLQSKLFVVPASSRMLWVDSERPCCFQQFLLAWCKTLCVVFVLKSGFHSQKCRT